jgi:enamine deaminase RidA (YjgF/YER057c/UK114 family)
MFRSVARAGDLIFVIGMIGRDEAGRVADGIVAQTRHALKRIDDLLAEQGLGREAIVRIRFFLTDMQEWPAARWVIEEFFHDDVPPALALAVVALADPSMKIEIEVEASAAVVT